MQDLVQVNSQKNPACQTCFLCKFLLVKVSCIKQNTAVFCTGLCRNLH